MNMTTNQIPKILSNYRTIAVVGLSTKPNRASHEVSAYMQVHGYRIIPVNPSYAGTYILGEYCYATLKEAAENLAKQNVVIEIVNCFRKSEDILPLAKDAIAIKAKCLWLQLGIINDGAAALASEARLQVVQDRCIKIDHMLMPTQTPEL